jgi:hypothetical protein
MLFVLSWLELASGQFGTTHLPLSVNLRSLSCNLIEGVADTSKTVLSHTCFFLQQSWPLASSALKHTLAYVYAPLWGVCHCLTEAQNLSGPHACIAFLLKGLWPALLVLVLVLVLVLELFGRVRPLDHFRYRTN